MSAATMRGSVAGLLALAALLGGPAAGADDAERPLLLVVQVFPPTRVSWGHPEQEAFFVQHLAERLPRALRRPVTVRYLHELPGYEQIVRCAESNGFSAADPVVLPGCIRAHAGELAPPGARVLLLRVVRRRYCERRTIRGRTAIFMKIGVQLDLWEEEGQVREARRLDARRLPFGHLIRRAGDDQYHWDLERLQRVALRFVRRALRRRP